MQSRWSPPVCVCFYRPLRNINNNDIPTYICVKHILSILYYIRVWPASSVAWCSSAAVIRIHVRKIMINYWLGGGRAIAIIMSFLPVDRGTPSIHHPADYIPRELQSIYSYVTKPSKYVHEKNVLRIIILCIVNLTVRRWAQIVYVYCIMKCLFRWAVTQFLVPMRRMKIGKR